MTVVNAVDDDPAVDLLLGRLHRWLGVLLLVTVPWLVDPGEIEADTKLDLVTTPWRYLGRALDAWDVHSGFGQMQNQAYGYLFPMGPFFGVGDTLGLSPWVTQRLWWVLLLVVAYLGTERLVRRLGVAGTAPAAVAGVAYALSPRVLTVLSGISVEAWPLAICPWLVLALEPALRSEASRHDRQRAGVLTGLLATAVGGVNATASLAVFVVPLVYLLTAPAGRRRAAALGWWLAGAALGSAWWLLPLLTLGRFAYPFLDFIETASTTTAVTNLPNALRGTSHWVAYVVDSEHHPVWQAGWILGQWALPVMATAVVAAFGVAGLITTRQDEQRLHVRRFGAASVVVGVVVLGLGYVGPVSGPQAEAVRVLLDGPLSALRNVHKFDPLVRLPLILGLAALLGSAARHGAHNRRWVTVPVALVVAVTPLWDGHLGSAGAYPALPAYWYAAASRVDELAARSGGATLLLPASRFADYTWGNPGDEPLVALARSPVVVRNAVPLGAPGSARLLDAAERLFASGAAQPSLAAGLARMGIARVVVRDDLAPAVGASQAQPVRRTLQRSPGFREVESFGEAATLWVVDPTGRERVAAYGYDSAVPVQGGPEALFALQAAGVVGEDTAVVLAKDDPRAVGVKGPVVLSDTLRRRTLDAAAPVADEYGPTLTLRQRPGVGRPVADLPPGGSGAPETVRTLVGARSVQASSSAADPFATGYRGPAAGPFAAIDGDPSTSWLSGNDHRSASLRVTLTSSRVLHRVRVFLTDAPRTAHPDTVTVSAAGGQVSRRVGPGLGVTVHLGGVKSSEIVVRLRRAAGSPAGSLGVRELVVDGVRLGTSVRVGPPVDGQLGAVVLARDSEDGEVLQRSVAVRRTVDRAVSLWVRPSAPHSPPGARLSCGGAGTVRVGSRIVRFRAVLTAAQVRSRALVEARPCGSRLVTLSTPATPVTATTGTRVRPDLVTLTDPVDVPGKPAAPSGRRTSVTFWSSQERTVRVSAGDVALLTLAEGFNDGWRAEAGGVVLRPVRVDGWRQGFLLPASGRVTVQVSFAPAAAYEGGLLTGGAGILVLLLAVLIQRRRTVRPAPAPAPARQAPLGGGHRARVVVGVTVAVVAVLLAGLAGLVVAVAAAMVPPRARSGAAGLAVVVGAALLMLFGVASMRQWGAGSSQLLSLLGVLLLLLAAFLPAPGRTLHGLLQAPLGQRGDAGRDAEHDEEDRPERRPEQ